MRHAHVSAVILALTAPALAGCLDGLTTSPTPIESPGIASWTQDCSIAPLTQAWSDPCTALASYNPSPSKSEIDLAVNPTDPLNVVVASKDLDPAASDCVWSVAQVTKDGGRTWKTVYVGGDLANRAPEVAPYSCVTDPIMAFDKDGVFYYALQAYDNRAVPHDLALETPFRASSGSAFVLARSLDGGETYDKYVVQHVGDGFAVFHDYPRMLYTPGTGSVHTIWNGVALVPGGGVNAWVSTTRDQGETVDPPVMIAAEDAPRGTAFFSGFAAASDGTIYVTIAKYAGVEGFLSDGGGDERDVFLFKSEDDGRSFQEVGRAFSFVPTPRQLPENDFRTPSFVEMAIDTSEGPYKDRIHVFYPDYANDDSDVLTRVSDDGGATWSEPVNVATDPAHDQFFMRPTVGPDGTVHALFTSRAFDPDNKLLDQVHAFSRDGGQTWANTRLTNSGFDGDRGVHQDGFPFIGDYNGIAVGPEGTVWTAWGDTRTGVAEIAVARLAPE